jgi:hypothetical protein
MSTRQFAKTARALAASHQEAAELRAKLAGFEKRAAAESFLISMMEDSRAPLALKPSSVADFMSKRAAIEKQDLEVAKLAAKMVGSQGFEIGDPEEPSPLFPEYNGSRADAEFTEWLAGLA